MRGETSSGQTECVIERSGPRNAGKTAEGSEAKP